MQLALSTTITPPPIPVWDELSGNLRQGFTTKNRTWNPGPNEVNSTTQIGLRASLFLEGFRQSHSARYYNPTTGRFMSRDPEPGYPYDPKTIHKYLYAGGDPIDSVDPSGRDFLEYQRLTWSRERAATVTFNKIAFWVAACYVDLAGTTVAVLEHSKLGTGLGAVGSVLACREIALELGPALFEGVIAGMF